MTAIARNFARYIALPVVSAGLIAGTALGLAGTANADTNSIHPQPRPGIVAVPDTSVHQPMARFPSKRTERLAQQHRNYGH